MTLSPFCRAMQDEAIRLDNLIGEDALCQHGARDVDLGIRCLLKRFG